jgi:PAS domain-containing protein
VPTTQKELEIILTRQLSSYLATPIFLVDPEGSLIFYNEPAEAILGRRFEETGEMGAAEWVTLFEPTRADGTPVARDELPLIRTLSTRTPCSADFWIVGLDGRRRHLEVVAVPLLGQAARFLGGMALFWEREAAP